MTQLATTHPAEVLDISPEALEVANCYLQVQDKMKVASELGIAPETVMQLLGRREVRAYIDNVFMDLGFNNRFKMRLAMDAILSKKFEEMDESGLGSGKDILDIMALSHKMTMELMAKEIELEKLRISRAPKTQTNIQINNENPPAVGAEPATPASNYSQLLERIIRQGNV
jgi:hypothetical protein